MIVTGASQVTTSATRTFEPGCATSVRPSGWKRASGTGARTGDDGAAGLLRGLLRHAVQAHEFLIADLADVRAGGHEQLDLRGAQFGRGAHHVGQLVGLQQRHRDG